MTWLISLQTGLETGLIMFFAVLGLAAAYRLLNFPDLTVEGSFLLGAVGFAVAARQGLGIPASLLAGVVLGGMVGALTGFLHARFHINKFLAGIIVVSISYTLALRLMGTSNIGLLSTAYQFDRLVGWGQLFDLQAGKMLVFLIMAAAIGILTAGLMSSRTGLRWRVAACNPDYARTLGIGVVASTVLGLAVTNALAALSGAFLAVHQGFSDVSLGQGVLILTLASMSIGDRLLSEHRLSVPAFVIVSSILGSIAYQCLISAAVRAGLNPVDLKLTTAIMVLVLIVVRSKRRDDPFVSA
jgi:putative ABC transport system permease protein